MDKTIEILLAATVMIIMGVMVIGMTTSGISIFEDEAEEVSGQGCEYQQERVVDAQLDGSADPDRQYDTMSERCREDGLFRHQVTNIGVVDSLNSDTTDED